MELRDVRYFIAVAEELSFRRAAARLHLTQPSLSQAIRKLERQVGAILFDRSTRHVELTEAGSAFLVQARRLTALADQTVERVRRSSAGGGPETLDAGPSEVTSLAVNMPSETNETARKVIGHLIAAAPRIGVTRCTLPSRDVRAALIDGRLDAVIGRAFVEDDRFAVELLRRERLVVFLPRGHRLATAAEVRLIDLEGIEVYVPSREIAPAWFQYLAGLFDEAGVTPSFVPARHGLGPVAFADVTANRGIAAIAVESDIVDTDGVVVRPIADRSATYPWSVITRRGDGREHVEAFRAAARAVRAREGWVGVGQDRSA